MTTPNEPGLPGQPGENKPFEPMPAAPALNEQELAPAAPVSRPKPVGTAFVLWIVVGAILLLSAVLVMVVSTTDLEDTIRKALEDSGRRPTPQEVTDAANVARTSGIVYNLLFAVLIVGFAFAMRAGKSWARISVCVAGGLVLATSLFFGGNLLILLPELVLMAVAAFLMFRPESNQFFKAGRPGGVAG